jgi:hypothetical protein
MKQSDLGKSLDPTAEATMEHAGERTNVRNGLMEERANVRMGKIGDWAEVRRG